MVIRPWRPQKFFLAPKPSQSKHQRVPRRRPFADAHPLRPPSSSPCWGPASLLRVLCSLLVHRVAVHMPYRCWPGDTLASAQRRARISRRRPAGVPAAEPRMGLCRCRVVTNLFCFEHKTNVCEKCIVASHPRVRTAKRATAAQDTGGNGLTRLAAGMCGVDGVNASASSSRTCNGCGTATLTRPAHSAAKASRWTTCCG